MGLTDKAVGSEENQLRLEYLRKRRFIEQIRSAEALARQKLGKDRSSEIKMKSILNQFADRLADKEKLEFPKYNSLAGGNPIENRWNQLEEVIEVMELEIAINAVFMNQKMMRSTLTRTGSPSQAHIYPIFAQSHLKQVYRKLSESVYFSA